MGIQPAQPTPPKEMAQFFSFDKFEITLSQPTMYLKARLWAMIDRWWRGTAVAVAAAALLLWSTGGRRVLEKIHTDTVL